MGCITSKDKCREGARQRKHARKIKSSSRASLHDETQSSSASSGSNPLRTKGKRVRPKDKVDDLLMKDALSIQAVIASASPSQLQEWTDSIVPRGYTAGTRAKAIVSWIDGVGNPVKPVVVILPQSTSQEVPALDAKNLTRNHKLIVHYEGRVHKGRRNKAAESSSTTGSTNRVVRGSSGNLLQDTQESNAEFFEVLVEEERRLSTMEDTISSDSS
jgi:hypothetical protein